MAAREGKLTPGERRAWRAGFNAGVANAVKQLELFAIRFATRGVLIDAPVQWPTVSRGRGTPSSTRSAE